MPRPIKIAIGFLAADALWVLLLLVKIGPLVLSKLDQHPLLLAPLSGFIAWFAVAALSIVGLRRRARSALTSSIALMATSAILLAVPMTIEILNRGVLLDLQSLVILSAFTCFLTPLILLLAGRRAYLSPPRA